MSAVGLFYVGSVLIINGLVLLKVISAEAATPLNLFVGALQVTVPTALLLHDPGPMTAADAGPLYLFGFTYLWVGINAITGWDPRGFGWFSLFVAITAVAVSGYTGLARGDGPFAVIWLYWAVLWFLFFCVLGLGLSRLTRTTGWFAIVTGVATAAVPGFLLMTGYWPTTPMVTIGLVAVALLTLIWLGAAAMRPAADPTRHTAAEPAP
ncbi:MAG: transporter [Nocardiopsaceae bacterium]|nr:transporter [Nocardiopsaceae bacterium]